MRESVFSQADNFVSFCTTATESPSEGFMKENGRLVTNNECAELVPFEAARVRENVEYGCTEIYVCNTCIRLCKEPQRVKECSDYIEVETEEV